MEFDQHIHIAFGFEIIPQNGAKKSKPADVVFAEKG
jgi:hypothetical protein